MLLKMESVFLVVYAIQAYVFYRVRAPLMVSMFGKADPTIVCGNDQVYFHDWQRVLAF